MHKERAKMSRVGRAKQFMPFAALGGLERALAEKEEQVSQRFLRPSAEKTALVKTLLSLTVGQKITVTALTESGVQRLTGRVRAVDTKREVLRFDGMEIPFRQIETVEQNTDGWI